MGHMVVLFLVFKESPYCLPWWLYQFTFSTAFQEGSLFSTPSPAFIVCRLFGRGHSDQMEKAMATHSSTLAWKIPWMEESMGSRRVGHD